MGDYLPQPHILDERHYDLPIKIFDENGEEIKRVKKVNLKTGEVETCVVVDANGSLTRETTKHRKITIELTYPYE